MIFPKLTQELICQLLLLNRHSRRKLTDDLVDVRSGMSTNELKVLLTIAVGFYNVTARYLGQLIGLKLSTWHDKLNDEQYIYSYISIAMYQIRTQASLVVI